VKARFAKRVVAEEKEDKNRMIQEGPEQWVCKHLLKKQKRLQKRDQEKDQVA